MWRMGDRGQGEGIGDRGRGDRRRGQFEKRVTVNHYAYLDQSRGGRVLFKEHHMMWPLSQVLQQWNCYSDSGCSTLCCSVLKHQVTELLKLTIDHNTVRRNLTSCKS